MPPYRPGSYVVDEYMPFYFNFNRQGFLPLCIPRIANFGRTHADQGGEVRAAEVHRTIAAYHGWMRDYSRELRKGGAIHVFRDGTGKVIGQYCCCSR